MSDGFCIRCESGPVTADGELCLHCVWAVRAETARGLDAIGVYLAKWAAFNEYLYERNAGKRAYRRGRRSWLRGLAA